MTEPQRWGGGPYDRPLRTVIVTQEDPFYIGAFFRAFFGTPSPRKNDPTWGGTAAEILGVVIQPSLGSSGPLELAGRIWSLYGTLGFVRMGLRYISVKLRGSGIEKACNAAGIPILEFPEERSIGKAGAERPPRPNNVNGPSFHRWVQEEKVDLIVSVSASQIFGRTVLGIPTIGCVNLHNAPLPRYRGMLPNFRQMYDGATESILTIHEMVPDLDAGQILAQGSTPIDESTTLEELMTRSKENSARALWEFLKALHAGEIVPRPMEGEGSYYTWPSRREVREFYRKGKRVW